MSTLTASTNGKAPVVGPERRPHDGLVQVQPARLEDLQPKYAQTIKHDEDNPAAHGWYASMSESFLSQRYSRAQPYTNQGTLQYTAWASLLDAWAPFPAVAAAPIHSSP